MSAADLIEGYMAHLREQSCTTMTLVAYRYQLTRADGELPYGVDGSNEAELRAWIWRGDLAPASRALGYSALTGFFRWAVRYGQIDFDPMTDIPRPKVPAGIPRVATDEQVDMLVNYARQPYRLWATLAAYGGLRCIEVHRQQREQITEERIVILGGKGNKNRAVPTHPVIWAAVKDLPPGRMTNAPDERRISTNFQRYCIREAQIPMSMHPLRAWFATTMYRETRDLQAVSQLLGHSNLAVTARYLGMGEREMRAAVSALPTLGVRGAASVPPAAAGPSRPRPRLQAETSAPAAGGRVGPRPQPEPRRA